MTDLATITENIRTRLGEDSGLGKTVKIDLGDDGKIFIDGASTPNTVTNDDGPADAVISISKEDFLAMASGELDGMMAFMQGKLRVQGDMMLAQRLGPLLRG